MEDYLNVEFSLVILFLSVMLAIVHIIHRFAGSLLVLMMDIFWLLIVIVGLATTDISCHCHGRPEIDFANPPPLPAIGLSYILVSECLKLCRIQNTVIVLITFCKCIVYHTHYITVSPG